MELQLCIPQGFIIVFLSLNFTFISNFRQNILYNMSHQFQGSGLLLGHAHWEPSCRSGGQACFICTCRGFRLHVQNPSLLLPKPLKLPLLPVHGTKKIGDLYSTIVITLKEMIFRYKADAHWSKTWTNRD